VSALTPANVRAFLNRDWDAVRRIKDERVGRRVRASGATAAFALAQMLLDQVWDRVRRDETRGDVRGLLALEEKLARARA
jgi:hypothetical protein